VARIDSLVIGSGAYGQLPVMQEVRREAARLKIKLFVLATAEAIEAFGTRPEGHQCHPPCDMLVVCHRLSRCTILGQLTGRTSEGPHLLVKELGTGSVDVYLCPKSFFDGMGHGLHQGRRDHAHRLESETGRSGIRPRARSVKGNNTFVLRDAKGDPVGTDDVKEIAAIINWGGGRVSCSPPPRPQERR
jgi:hypothetical protein